MDKIVSGGASLAVVWTTVDSLAAARALAATVLEQRLAACVQIDTAIESHYVWKGKRRVDTEYRLAFKTTHSVSEALVSFLGTSHPYDEPQILVLPVTHAAAGYARWVNDQTGAESSG